MTQLMIARVSSLSVILRRAQTASSSLRPSQRLIFSSISSKSPYSRTFREISSTPKTNDAKPETQVSEPSSQNASAATTGLSYKEKRRLYWNKHLQAQAQTHAHAQGGKFFVISTPGLSRGARAPSGVGGGERDRTAAPAASSHKHKAILPSASIANSADQSREVVEQPQKTYNKRKTNNNTYDTFNKDAQERAAETERQQKQQQQKQVISSAALTAESAEGALPLALLQPPPPPLPLPLFLPISSEGSGSAAAAASDKASTTGHAPTWPAPAKLFQRQLEQCLSHPCMPLQSAPSALQAPRGVLNDSSNNNNAVFPPVSAASIRQTKSIAFELTARAPKMSATAIADIFHCIGTASRPVNSSHSKRDIKLAFQIHHRLMRQELHPAMLNLLGHFLRLMRPTPSARQSTSADGSVKSGNQPQSKPTAASVHESPPSGTDASGSVLSSPLPSSAATAEADADARFEQVATTAVAAAAASGPARGAYAGVLLQQVCFGLHRAGVRWDDIHGTLGQGLLHVLTQPDFTASVSKMDLDRSLQFLGAMGLNWYSIPERQALCAAYQRLLLSPSAASSSQRTAAAAAAAVAVAEAEAAGKDLAVAVAGEGKGASRGKKGKNLTTKSAEGESATKKQPQLQPQPRRDSSVLHSLRGLSSVGLSLRTEEISDELASTIYRAIGAEVPLMSPTQICQLVDVIARMSARGLHKMPRATVEAILDRMGALQEASVASSGTGLPMYESMAPAQLASGNAASGSKTARVTSSREFGIPDLIHGLGVCGGAGLWGSLSSAHQALLLQLAAIASIAAPGSADTDANFMHAADRKRLQRFMQLSESSSSSSSSSGKNKNNSPFVAGKAGKEQEDVKGKEEDPLLGYNTASVAQAMARLGLSMSASPAFLSTHPHQDAYLNVLLAPTDKGAHALPVHLVALARIIDANTRVSRAEHFSGRLHGKDRRGDASTSSAAAAATATATATSTSKGGASPSPLLDAFLRKQYATLISHLHHGCYNSQQLCNLLWALGALGTQWEACPQKLQNGFLSALAKLSVGGQMQAQEAVIGNAGNDGGSDASKSDGSGSGSDNDFTAYGYPAASATGSIADPAVSVLGRMGTSTQNLSSPLGSVASFRSLLYPQAAKFSPQDVYNWLGALASIQMPLSAAPEQFLASLLVALTDDLPNQGPSSVAHMTELLGQCGLRFDTTAAPGVKLGDRDIDLENVSNLDTVVGHLETPRTRTTAAAATEDKEILPPFLANALGLALAKRVTTMDQAYLLRAARALSGMGGSAAVSSGATSHINSPVSGRGRALGASLPLLDCGGMNRSLSQRMVEALRLAISRHIDALGSSSSSGSSILIDNSINFNGRGVRDQHQLQQQPTDRFRPPQLLELVASVHSMTFVTARSLPSISSSGGVNGSGREATAAAVNESDTVSTAQADATAAAMAVEHRLLGGVQQLHTAVLSALSRETLSDADISDMFAQPSHKDKRLHTLHVARVCQYLCMSEEDVSLVMQALNLQSSYARACRQSSELALASDMKNLPLQQQQQQLHAQSSVQAFSMLVLEASRVSERILRVLGAKST